MPSQDEAPNIAQMEQQIADLRAKKAKAEQDIEQTKTKTVENYMKSMTAISEAEGLLTQMQNKIDQMQELLESERAKYGGKKLTLHASENLNLSGM